MKIAPSTFAPAGMAALAIAFIVVMALTLVWPKSPGNNSTGYSSDGTAVQSDTISPQTAAKDGASTK